MPSAILLTNASLYFTFLLFIQLQVTTLSNGTKYLQVKNTCKGAVTTPSNGATPRPKTAKVFAGEEHLQRRTPARAKKFKLIEALQ